MSADPKGLGAVFDAHTDAEFKTRDIEATMATMGEAPHVTHVPTMTGGHGQDEVRRFYETWFIGHWPEDTEITPVSRTVGETQVVDEIIIRFTHDCEMPALLPGVAPTGRKVVIPFVVVVGFAGGKIAFERIYWDQASMLVQLGLIDKSARCGCASPPPAASKPSAMPRSVSPVCAPMPSATGSCSRRSPHLSPLASRSCATPPTRSP